MGNRFLAAVFAFVLAMGMCVTPAIADSGVGFAVASGSTLSVSKADAVTKSGREVRKSISQAKVSVKAQLYTGKAITPNVKVSLGKKKLVTGRDYRVIFKNNVNPGKATVLVAGAGNYKGHKKASFQIKTKKGLKIVGNSAYFFKNTKGAKATGWVKSGSKWYWANSRGKLVSGWKRISGVWYYLDTSNYAMKTGWQKIGGKWYYFYKSGAMASNVWVGDYYLKSNGAMATNQWIGDYWVDGSGKWTDTRSDTVYITRTGAKFHSAGCRWLYASKIPISRGDAIARGYQPCSVCNP